MSISIGEKIREFAKSKGWSQKDFGLLINHHEKTVANIYNRKTIDTDLLLSICKATNHDFFNYYYQTEPLKTFRENELEIMRKRIEELELSTKQKDSYISLQTEYIKNQNEVIRLLQEKEIKNKKNN